MLFSIGNIITILIVLVILALYRQLDRNNRSLDKVRRYTSKVTSDIEAFVDQKTQDMKNLAIEIDVHQKTGKEVLKRISAIEEGFKHRTADIDHINAKIGEYDKSLKELAGMTGKVDENLQRLHQESEFVDKVGRRLKDAQTRMTQLEKSIPALNNEFSAKNEKELEKLRIELMSGVERQAVAVIDKVTSSAERVDEFSSHLDSLEARRDMAAEEAMTQVRAGIETAVGNADDQLRQLSGDFSESLDRLTAAAEMKKSELSVQLDESESNFRAHVEEIGEILNTKLVSFKDSINSLEESYQHNLKDSAEKAKKLEDDVFVSLKSYIEEKSRDSRRQINAALEDLKKGIISYRSDIDASFGDSQSEIKVWRAKLGKDLEDGSQDIDRKLSEFEKEFESQIAALMPKTSERLEQLEAEGLNRINGARADVLGRIENMISVVNEKESQLSEFEENLAYKLTRIEEITSDIDLLENNLNQMVERAVEETSDGFEAIKAEMTDRWQHSSNELAKDISSSREVMSELESELDALKASAYDNVSVKLKDFEDGFFDDLKEKSGLMEKRLAEWQHAIDDRLDRMAIEATSAREELEAVYTEEVSVKMAGLREKTSSQFGSYEQQVENYRSIVEDRLRNIDGSIEQMKTGIRSEISEANNELEGYLQNELNNFRTSLEADMGRVIREAENSIHEVEELVAADRERVKGLLDAQNNELELWQSRLQQQLVEMQNNTQEQYSQIKVEASDRMSEIREALSVQRNDFDMMSSEIQRRSRELNGELEQSLKDFDDKAAEINESFALANKRLYEGLEQQGRELSFTIAEIDKQQKSFIAQTKIFERADSMKEALESGIEELKSEVTRVTAQASEIREAEKKFLAVRKQADELNTKMTKFNTERRRIEELEEDFKKLMSISQSVDAKLMQVTSSDDSLQLIQARLMELDGLQKEVEGRYERLQKKETIVDSTIDGVDRSFKQLNELDHMISVLEERSTPLNSRLDELTSRIDFLSRNKKQIDTAIGHIENIDTTLVDLEDRIEKMQKAREWLAGTETRLEEVNKQAQEQVRLLGTLVKGSESKTRSGGGAPPFETRDVVIKLARQGWTVEQIAKTTKLARGEVELILELQPKNS